MSYDTFAAFYDDVMDDTYYEQWLSYAQSQLPKTTNRVLDIGCGTGKLAVEFSRAGYSVTGLDLSENMLSLAYNRSLEAGETIQFIQGDMRELDEVGKYDAVTCFSDSLCYMENEDEVSAVFQGVRESLYSGGYFLFDVHSLFKVNTVFPGYQYHFTNERGAFLWSSFQGEEEGTIEHDLTFFIPERGTQRYARYEEVHKERTYSIEVYTKLLEQAGFINIQVSSDFGRKEVTDTTERLFFSCQTKD